MIAALEEVDRMLKPKDKPKNLLMTRSQFLRTTGAVFSFPMFNRIN